MRRRAAFLVIGAGAWLAIVGWIAAGVIAERRVKDGLRLAGRDLAEGRVAEAREALARLAEDRPGRGEIELMLGDSEVAAGHPDAALAAWGRVPDGSPEAARAALARGRLALDLGRYAMAEACLERAARAGGVIGDEGRRQLARLAWHTGRVDEHRRLLGRDLERSPDPSETLRLLWNIDSQAYPIEGMRQVIEKAARAAPDDDRVWLASADLAARAGRLEEADGWLRRCERARPDDPAVRRARLDWARAADRPDAVLEAARRLPASALSERQVGSLRAWLAARSGDVAAERKALEDWIAIEPGSAAALSRLSDLAAEAGDSARVADLRRRKATIDAATDRYRRLMASSDLAPRAAELARVAESLSRWPDARAWWDLASRRDPTIRPEADAARARLERARPTAAPGSGRTLADLLAPAGSSPGREAVAADALDVPAFADDAAARGLVFTFDNGKSDRRQLPETMSGGVGLLDFDGDGRLDVYAVQGGRFPPPEGPRPFGDRLFRNIGGRFEDATASSGLLAMPGGYGHGVAVGDYDGDGRPDLFVTRWGAYALYHNLGGRFEDATARAGLGGDRDWPTSAAWADLDGDGDLDLYVCHYLKWDAINPTICSGPASPGPTYCDPREFPALPDHVFRNDGGTFVDVTEAAGIVDREGRGLGVVADDLDGDGKIDLFVANDTSANYFFRNLGGFRFAEEGHQSGLATGANGGYLAGMGVARGDLDGDGRLDLAVTNFYGESTTLYHDLGRGLFADRTASAGLSTPTRFMLGFGLAALDANNDGRLDLVQSNGHVNDFRPSTPFLMTPQLFLGDGRGRLVDVSDRAGPAWKAPRLGRGLAVGDLDDDGRLDVLIVADGAPLSLLGNRGPTRGHFLALALEGKASNRDGVGARVTVTAGGRVRVATRFGGGSYLSSSDPRLHFGLGSAEKADRVEVAWPSGRVDRFEGLAADAAYRLVEGDSTPHPVPMR